MQITGSIASWEFSRVAVERKDRQSSIIPIASVLQNLPLQEEIRGNLRDKIFILESASITESWGY